MTNLISKCLIQNISIFKSFILKIYCRSYNIDIVKFGLLAKDEQILTKCLFHPMGLISKENKIVNVDAKIPFLGSRIKTRLCFQNI